ncbi:zeta toxin, partial [Staphylococcus aureus]
SDFNKVALLYCLWIKLSKGKFYPQRKNI